MFYRYITSGQFLLGSLRLGVPSQHLGSHHDPNIPVATCSVCVCMWRTRTQHIHINPLLKKWEDTFIAQILHHGWEQTPTVDQLKNLCFQASSAHACNGVRTKTPPNSANSTCCAVFTWEELMATTKWTKNTTSTINAMKLARRN